MSPNKTVVIVIAIVIGSFLSAGCSSTEPARLKDDDDVQKLVERVKADPAAPRPKLAIVPVVATYPTTYDLAARPGQMPAPLDRAQLTADLAGDLEAFAGFEKKRVLPDPEALPPEERATALASEFREAAAAGADVLLVPRLTQFDTYFEKRNGKWIWNMGLWLYLWFPSFWVADEDYGAKAKLECAFYSVASERLLYSTELKAETTQSLDMFDRGWDFFGIFTIPASLDGDQMHRVARRVDPFVTRQLEKKVVFEVAEELPTFLRVGEGAALGARDATTYALVVGVSRYQDDATIDGPEGAARDAAAVEAMLRKVGVPAKNIDTLADARATGFQVRRRLEALAQRARPQDTLLVYFSGCGTAAGADAWLLPFDASVRKLDPTAISLAQLSAQLRAARAGRAIVVCDAAFGPHAGGTRSLKGAAAPEAPPPEVAFTRATAGGKDLTLLLACGAAEDATDLAEAKSGLFTYMLVEGATGRADADASGSVSLPELAAYVARQVRAQAGLDGVTQIPTLYRDGARVAIDTPSSGDSWLPTASSEGARP